MEHKVYERTNYPGTWAVEATNEEGTVFTTIFLGPASKTRAIQYAAMMYG